MRKAQVLVYLLLLLGFVLFLVFVLTRFGLFSLKGAREEVGKVRALFWAESAIKKVRWCANHDLLLSCPTSFTFYDREGKEIGEATASVVLDYACSYPTLLQIEGTGKDKESGMERKIKVVLGRDSVARFSYLLNSSVWVGEDHQIKGAYLSNGGIRMDGFNNSQVISAKENWVCTSSFGCQSCPSQCQATSQGCLCPGVFTTTSNSNPQLFTFPSTPFDFSKISLDLSEMKERTYPYYRRYYWPPAKEIKPGAKGYHLVFKEDGQVEIRLVEATRSYFSYSLEEGWHYDPFGILRETTLAVVTPPSSCSLLFFEDNIWVEGRVKGNITVASATFSVKPSTVVLVDSLVYTSLKDSLLLVSEGNILISPESPSYMRLEGVFVAQKGRFSRNHYPYNFRERLEIKGTIVSNGRVGTKWISAGGRVVSGYLQRETVVDNRYLFYPPPFLPALSPDFKVLRWEEIP